jgi:predicted CXXCH cytochrome family protein
MAFWNMSRHKTADVSCDICHLIHTARVEKDLLKEKEPDLCFGCHKNIRAQVNKRSHHPSILGMLTRMMKGIV